MNDPISQAGLILFAILIPTGLMLGVAATTSSNHTRRFARASAGTFLLLALWFGAAAVIRMHRGELGPLLSIELALMIGTGLQGWWIGRALGSDHSDDDVGEE